MHRSLPSALATLAAPLLVGAAVQAQSFTFLDPNFTQELYAVDPSFLGGVAFAPNGDVWADHCAFSGSALERWDNSATTLINGSNVHNKVGTFPSNAGCGLTNHPNGTLYTNTSNGVVQLDVNTAVQIGVPFGTPGNALGITPDPISGDLVYVAADGSLAFVTSDLSTNTGTYSTVTTGNFLDGIFFDPTGQFVFCANRSPIFRCTIIDRNGALVQQVDLPSEPDGIAFHDKEGFVLTINLDGTISRLDFPNQDYSLSPTITLFASGGFRGDLSQVGPDGSLYLTQAGTRYDDGTVTGENSIVRITGGFSTPPGACPGTAVHFGSGVAGLNGKVPNLRIGCPAIGTSIVVNVEDGRANTVGCLLLGLAQTTAPLYAGTLYVDQTFVTETHALDGNGEAALPFTIPNDPSFVGVNYFMQAGYVDAAAAQRVSLTDALMITMGG